MITAVPLLHHNHLNCESDILNVLSSTLISLTAKNFHKLSLEFFHSYIYEIKYPKLQISSESESYLQA